MCPRPALGDTDFELVYGLDSRSLPLRFGATDKNTNRHTSLLCVDDKRHKMLHTRIRKHLISLHSYNTTTGPTKFP